MLLGNLALAGVPIPLTSATTLMQLIMPHPLRVIDPARKPFRILKVNKSLPTCEFTLCQALENLVERTGDINHQPTKVANLFDNKKCSG